MYQALYRKWRPRTFDDVVGQGHITETLKRQVAAGRLSHAYLFTGTRGTGKTTCAKILARAVNCQDPQDGNPCNHCSSCLGIENGSVLDVLELDAASNNRVDDIRAILDEAMYTPATVKKRVYIVDEVHMLSAQAFNALLQILEEPPEHLMFILATTEIHKVPATIKSRCQQFAFKRIRAEEIAGRLRYVAGQEGINLTDDGANLLARLAKRAVPLKRAAPPVRMRVAGEPSSASMRWTIPSSIAAMPTMVPERMHSSVFLPMMRFGIWRSSRGSWAVRSERAPSPISSPGAMAPPQKTLFSRMTLKVVAVPRLPGLGGMGSKMKGLDDEQTAEAERKMGRMEAIIHSMTPAERANPDILSPSRKHRIAKGAGVDISEVNRMIKQFNEMKKLMKQFGKPGKKKKFGFPF